MQDDPTLVEMPAGGTAAAAPRALTARPAAQASAEQGPLFCPLRGVQHGATRELAAGTARLLHSRLRVVVPLLAVILAAAAARFLWVQPEVAAIVPGAGAAVLAVLAVLLSTGATGTMAQLRAFEAITFGTLLLAAATNNIVLVSLAADAGDGDGLRLVLNRIPIVYVMIMLAYGIFIPNPWKRTAAVVGVIAATPLLVAEVAARLHPGVGGLLGGSERIEYLSYATFGVAAAAILVVVGARTVEGYRRQIAEADEAGMYRLQGKLGAGGMGEVWRAEHRLLARPAAIKMIKPEILATDGSDLAQKAVERFRREARATAALESPHTVQLYDFGVTIDGTFFYVMEYLDGFDFNGLVERFGPLPPARALYLLRQGAESLAEAHAHGLVHRDIKPANLHVGRRAGHHDWVRVLDFGLVKTFEPDSDTTALTREGMAAGTPAYFAPEMARGAGAADARSDVYALGAVGFWLLTGQLVFPAAGPMDMIVRHIRDQPDRPSARLGTPLPVPIDELVLQCLAKDPAARPQSMDQLIAAIDRIHVDPPWNEERAAAWWAGNTPATQANVA